ncbi:imidazole glycerol phosphate synthase subunit HisH [Pseudoalteromonas ulvae]|uniref:Imidazole glycerol phosphate synthase subunit HisH n=1 Tax=Pseudoalteromonas ulvae TaxID=107327 RepID=A0A244CR74_PSEDV|nr:imidazole glycerol phosphate synthase subunit HisH [Pseudoalteromonas ulvae]OUL58121.1 imidazole glycerol phosphate synthase subunit HisH [Pseudoalteromonas ulvae]
MIAIINTGCANINSVRFAFERLNCPTEVISRPEQLSQFDRAILPGVGHASVAMKRLVDGGWQSAISEFEKPLMGICLGMQLLCESTEEGHIDTLGLIPGQVSLLDTDKLTSPHMGWNTLTVERPHALTQGLSNQDQVYFVHSFAHRCNDSTLVSGEYGNRFSAIISKDNFAGMQFHPERSAKVGAKLLNNFIEWRI